MIMMIIVMVIIMIIMMMTAIALSGESENDHYDNFADDDDVD